MQIVPDNGPPPDVTSALIRAGLDGAGAVWTPLRGGRTNRVWRMQTPTRRVVVKLYRDDGATPLFPNDAGAEAAALRALAGHALAPGLLADLDTESGRVLICDYLEGASAPDAPAAVGALLRRLHDIPAPTGLRCLAPGDTAILNAGDRMLRGLAGDDAGRLRALRPGSIAPGQVTPRFLHGDPVPANVMATAKGLRLIDWQCPAWGDPVEDLAIFLSPAMQKLYGGGLLGRDRACAFLAGYGHSARVHRYRDLAKAFHWRMAAYCLWKAARGDAEYAAAFGLEVAML